MNIFQFFRSKHKKHFLANDIWINLPVKDVTKARDFFIAVGFKLNEGLGNSENSAAIEIGSKNIILMLLEQNFFKQISGNELTDTSKSSEVLFFFMQRVKKK